MVTAGVAGGHPATVEAGVEILDAGGGAADAAVAATLASCVAETIMTGLGGGGFATYFDARDGRVTCLDFFVAVPGLDPPSAIASPVPIEVVFGDVPLEFSIGAATVAVPGTPAGCSALHRRFGRLPWRAVVAPAIALAESGVVLPAAHAEALPTIAPALLPGAGRSAYAPDGVLLRAGQRLHHAGLADTLRRLANDGAGVMYRGELAAAIVAETRAHGGILSGVDLSAYRVREVAVNSAVFGGCRVHGRHDLRATVDALARLDGCLGLDVGKRAAATAEILTSAPDAELGDTTNLSVVDHDGNACVVTTSLGIGSGIWPRDTGVHLNSMLGEGELRCGTLRPGARMASMMSPLVAVDARDATVRLAVGSAGASRIRSALVHVLTASLADGRGVAEAVATPRFHPVGERVHIEPGIDPRIPPALARAGYDVAEWSRDRHYFGGVSAVGPGGAAGDPRRGGAGSSR
ncbi:MAG: gamma-glutamyltransferase [Stackebrandtia sp.]